MFQSPSVGIASVETRKVVDSPLIDTKVSLPGQKDSTISTTTFPSEEMGSALDKIFGMGDKLELDNADKSKPQNTIKLPLLIRYAHYCNFPPGLFTINTNYTVLCPGALMSR